MDEILPSPPQDSAWALWVPYLTTFEYVQTKHGFRNRTCITSHSTRLQNVARRQPQRLSPFHAAALTQAWLFIGLLSDMFGPFDIHATMVVNPYGNDLRLILNKGRIEMIASDWFTRHRGPQYIHHLGKARELLAFAAKECDRMDIASFWHSATRYEDADWRVLRTVILSVRLLHEYLDSVLRRECDSYLLTVFSEVCHSSSDTSRYQSAVSSLASHEFPKQHVISPSSTDCSLTLSAQAMIERFELSGWCVSRARQLCRQHDYVTAYYLARTWQPETLNVSHEACRLSGVCIAYNIELSGKMDFEQSHQASCRGCTPSFALPTDLSEILNSGQIPLVSVNMKDPSDMRIEKYDGYTLFTAISHVWRDGLGNPHGNSVPFCQIQHIAELVEGLKKKATRERSRLEKFIAWVNIVNWVKYLMFRTRRVYFWLDVLCIPQGQDVSRDLKLKSLNTITPAMQAAQQILVLDSKLNHLDLGSLNREDSRSLLAATVLGSKWVQRGWTLEEGGLARKCYARVGEDRFECLSEGLHLDADSQSNVAWKDVPSLGTSGGKLLSSVLNGSRKHAVGHRAIKKARRHLDATRGKQFVDAWNNIQHRATSKPEDLVKVFANVLDLNQAAIESDLSLRLVIKSSSQVPLSVLFVGRNLGGGDGWLPTGISLERLSDNVVMKPTQDGAIHTGFSAQVSDIQNCPAVKMFHVAGITPVFRLEDYHGQLDKPQAGPGLVLFDTSMGSVSLSGRCAKGAFLQAQGSQWVVASTLTIWTLEQWHLQKAGAEENVPLLETTEHNLEEELRIHFEPIEWQRLLKQRPLLEPRTRSPETLRYLIYTPIAFLVSLAAGIALVVTCTKGGGRLGRGSCNEMRYYRFFVTLFLTPALILLTALLHKLIIRRRYQTWLKIMLSP